MAGELEQGLVLDPQGRAARDVVQDHRHVGRVGDGREVCGQPPLRRLVVVRRDDQQPVRADARRGLGEVEGFRRRVRADAGDHLAVPADRLGDRAEQIDLLGVREGRRLAGGSSRDDRVRSVRDEPARELLRPVEIEPVIVTERGDHRGDEGSEGAGHREEASFPGATARGPPDGPMLAAHAAHLHEDRRRRNDGPVVRGPRRQGRPRHGGVRHDRRGGRGARSRTRAHA